MTIRQFLDSKPTVNDVNEKIRLLQEDIRALQEYKNTRFLSVSRLPSEIFSSICEDLALEAFRTSRYSNTPYSDWLPVTQVCRQWRAVAINIPRIWSSISSGSPSIQLAELFLKRAGSTPLYLLSCLQCPNEKIIRLLLRRAHQLKQIVICECQKQWLSFIHDTPMPLLETMEIHLQSSTPALPIAPAIQPGMEPALRHLSFSSCTMDLQSPFFSRIRRLKIGNDPLQSLEGLLLALRTLVHLEHVELYMPDESDEAPMGLVVVLPRLTFLRLISYDISGLAIITRISCPAIQSLQVQCTMLEEIAAPFEDVASAFYAMISPASSTHWSIVVNLLSSTNYTRTVMEMWPGTICRDSWDISSSALSLVKDSDAPFWLSIGRMSDFDAAILCCSLLPTSDPFFLNIRQTDHTPFEYWSHNLRSSLTRLLRTFGDVQRLYTNDLGVMSGILSDTPEVVGIDEELPPFSLPSLRCMILDLRHLSGSLEFEPKKMARLRRYLEARKAVNCGIEMLKLIARKRMVSVDQEDLKLMEECVGTFEFIELLDPQ